MAPTLYPRSTLKKIVKAHANRPLSKNVDILVRSHFPRPWAALVLPQLGLTAQALLRSDLALLGADSRQIYLNYILFMQELMQEAGIKAKQSGERGISAKSIRRVREGCLRRAKG